MPRRDQARLLKTLEQILAIEDTDVRRALTTAADLVAAALAAEKVDVMRYDASVDSLVALGTSQTDMGRRQRQLGLERQAVSNGGHAVHVYLTGEPNITGHADQEPDELPGMINGSAFVPRSSRRSRRVIAARACCSPPAASRSSSRRPISRSSRPRPTGWVSSGSGRSSWSRSRRRRWSAPAPGRRGAHHDSRS